MPLMSNKLDDEQVIDGHRARFDKCAAKIERAAKVNCCH